VNVKIISLSSRSQEENVAEVVNVTSVEGFLVITALLTL